LLGTSAPAHGVDVESELNEKLDRAAAPGGGRPDDKTWACDAHLRGQAGVLTLKLVETAPVDREHRGHERVLGAQFQPRSAAADEELDELGVAGGGRHRRGGGAVLIGRQQIDAVLRDEPDPLGQAVG
jgi:hypothetical protein